MPRSDDDEAAVWRSEVAKLVPQIEEHLGLGSMPRGGEFLLYRMSLLAGLSLSLSALEGMKHMVPYWELQMRYAPRIKALQDDLVKDMVRLTTASREDEDR